MESLSQQSDELRARKTAIGGLLRDSTLSVERRQALEEELVLLTRALVAIERIERGVAEQQAQHDQTSSAEDPKPNTATKVEVATLQTQTEASSRRDGSEASSDEAVE